MPYRPKTNAAECDGANKRPNARLSTFKRGYDKKWQKFRAWYLRQYPMCEHCSERGVDTPAKDLHHVIPLRDGGEKLDEENVQGLCRSCHSRETVKEKKAFARVAKVIFVTGPPASGKTYYVLNNKEKSDLIIDVDMIYQAISGLEFYDRAKGLLGMTLNIRDFVLKELESPSGIDRAWIIAGMPDAVDREEMAERFGANIIVMEKSVEKCLSHIRGDSRRRSQEFFWKPLIEKWWSDYTKRDSDTIM